MKITQFVMRATDTDVFRWALEATAYVRPDEVRTVYINGYSEGKPFDGNAILMVNRYAEVYPGRLVAPRPVLHASHQLFIKTGQFPWSPWLDLIDVPPILAADAPLTELEKATACTLTA